MDYCPERLKYEEMKHIGKYRLLDKYGKDMVDTVLDMELMRCKDTSGS